MLVHIPAGQIQPCQKLNKTKLSPFIFFIVSITKNNTTGCLKIREFRIHSVVGKDQVGL
jgi:hypothetical protein